MRIFHQNLRQERLHRPAHRWPNMQDEPDHLWFDLCKSSWWLQAEFCTDVCNFDDLCPFKAPLHVNGENFDFEKHFLILLTDAERAAWWRLTVNHLKWKYIDAIKSRVQWAILFVFGRLPKQFGRLSTRNAITSFVPRGEWWSSRLDSLLVIISHCCASVEIAVLSQSLIGLRAAMSLALPARRCYQFLRDWCHQTILDTILMNGFNIIFMRTTGHSCRMRSKCWLRSECWLPEAQSRSGFKHLHRRKHHPLDNYIHLPHQFDHYTSNSLPSWGNADPRMRGPRQKGICY